MDKINVKKATGKSIKKTVDYLTIREQLEEVAAKVSAEETITTYMRVES